MANFCVTKLNTLIWLGLSLIALMVAYYIPPNMDSYLHYHPIACWHYPNSVLHVFREPCNGDLNLKLFDSITWPRAYNYVGATYSFLYYPLFLLWPHWYSTALLGILVMFPGVWAASKLLRINFSIAALILCLNFPIMFYIIRDYGQITIQLTLLYLLPWLAYKAVEANRASVWVPISTLIGLLFFFGVESKPVILYFVPAMALVTIAACWPLHAKKKLPFIILLRLSPGIVLSAGMLWVLLMAKNVMGVEYYYTLIAFPSAAQSLPQIIQHIADLVAVYWFNFRNVASLIYDGRTEPGIMTGNIVYDQYGILLTLPFWVVSALLVLWYCRVWLVRDPLASKNVMLIIGLFAATAIGLWVAGMDPLTRHPHHVLQAFYYFLGGLALIMHLLWQRNRLLSAVLAAILIVSQVVVTWSVGTQAAGANHNWDRVEVLEYIEEHKLAENNVINHMGWGIYYLSSLYGPKDQIVLFDATPEDAAAVANKVNRGLVFVTNKNYLPPPDLEMRRVYPAVGENKSWEIWLGPQ